MNCFGICFVDVARALLVFFTLSEKLVVVCLSIATSIVSYALVKEGQ